MTTQEVAQLVSTVGFVGFGILTAAVSLRIVRDGTMQQRGQAIICFGMFVSMFAAISAIGSLARPPFEWLDPESVSIANGIVVWFVFVSTAVGVTRES